MTTHRRYSVTSDGIYAAPGHATYVGLNLVSQKCLKRYRMFEAKTSSGDFGRSGSVECVDYEESTEKNTGQKEKNTRHRQAVTFG